MSKTVLRAVAAILILAAAGIWVAMGANRGWTKTSVPVKRTDEVTGITVDDYQKRFVPGVDFLGAALLGSGILAGASFLFRKKQTQS
jgi:thymidine phosphorylase